MSTKKFCDGCNSALPSENTNIVNNPITPPIGGVTIRIEAGFNKLGQGDVCPYCVIEEVIRYAKVRGWMPKEPEPSTPRA